MLIGGDSRTEWLRLDHWTAFAEMAGAITGEVEQQARANCKTRFEEEFGVQVIQRCRARESRSFDIVRMAEHNKTPWLKHKLREPVVPPPQQPKRPESFEQIYERVMLHNHKK